MSPSTPSRAAADEQLRQMVLLERVPSPCRHFAAFCCEVADRTSEPPRRLDRLLRLFDLPAPRTGPQPHQPPPPAVSIESSTSAACCFATTSAFCSFPTAVSLASVWVKAATFFSAVSARLR